MRHDLVHAARLLWRARTTSGIAILTLAAGIGFAVAVFSVADRVLFRPLPYLVPDQLVELRLAGLQMGNLPLSGRELASARSAPIFSAAEGYDTGGVVTRVDGPEPERIRLAHVTPGLLPLLGARIAHGRPLQPSDGAAGAEPVALLEHGFWQTRYGADPAVVGRVIRFDEGVALRVVGVLERDFVFPTTTPSSSPQVIETISEAQLAEDGRWLTVIARLHPGLQPSAADGALPVDSPPAGSQVHIASRPLHEALGYGARRGLIALLVGALALLLIGGLDVAGLLVAQATTRDREMAVRRALGAGTWPLVRQVLVEGGILAALSCAFGLLLAQWLFDSLMALVPPDLQLMQPAGVDLRGALVALAASAALTMLFGAAPLLHVRRTGTTAVLRSGATQTPSRVVRRFGSALVGAQIAIALVLVIAGGLLLTSFWNVRSIDVGVEAGGVPLRLGPGGRRRSRAHGGRQIDDGCD